HFAVPEEKEKRAQKSARFVKPLSAQRIEEVMARAHGLHLFDGRPGQQPAQRGVGAGGVGAEAVDGAQTRKPLAEVTRRAPAEGREQAERKPKIAHQNFVDTAGGSRTFGKSDVGIALVAASHWFARRQGDDLREGSDQFHRAPACHPPRSTSIWT